MGKEKAINKKISVKVYDEDGNMEEYRPSFTDKIIIRFAFFLYDLGAWLFGEGRMKEELMREGVRREEKIEIMDIKRKTGW
jgi:hypothetical protein